MEANHRKEIHAGIGRGYVTEPQTRTIYTLPVYKPLHPDKLKIKDFTACIIFLLHNSEDIRIETLLFVD